jgi:hypothetical protein
VNDAEFDAIFERIKKVGLAYGSAPWSPDDGKLNDWNGGRGVYFNDPNGRLLDNNCAAANLLTPAHANPGACGMLSTLRVSSPLIDFLLRSGLYVKHGRNAAVGCWLNDCWPPCPSNPSATPWMNLFDTLIVDCAVFPSSSIPSRSSAGWLPTVRADRAAA